MSLRENTAFTEKVINRAQRLSIAEPFCEALNEYLTRCGRILWEDGQALFWVIPPHGPAQVAVWLMPIAANFEPANDG